MLFAYQIMTYRRRHPLKFEQSKFKTNEKIILYTVYMQV